MSVEGVSGSTAPDQAPPGGTDETGKPSGGGDQRTFSTVNELQKEAPEFWYKQLLLMAQNMCSQMKKHSDKVVKKMKEGRSK